MTDVYCDWENEGNIALELFQDKTEEWWNRLNPIQRYNIFPWATGCNFGGIRDMIHQNEYTCKFQDLDYDIQEEIVEKFSVQKGLVKVPDNTNLPHWEEQVTEADKRILEI
jgi:hypothetical protein